MDEWGFGTATLKQNISRWQPAGNSIVLNAIALNLKKRIQVIAASSIKGQTICGYKSQTSGRMHSNRYVAIINIKPCNWHVFTTI